MTTKITLEWKSFDVKLDRIHRYFKEQCSSDYDGLITSEDNLCVILKNDNSSDISIITSYWNSITEEGTQALDQYELQQMIINKIQNAVSFGSDLMIRFASDNIAMGITQAGKTKAVSDYLADATRYVQTGSLYEVVHEVDRLLAAGIPSDLDPFITASRMNSIKQEILDYLS